MTILAQDILSRCHCGTLDEDISGGYLAQFYPDPQYMLGTHSRYSIVNFESLLSE